MVRVIHLGDLACDRLQWSGSDFCDLDRAEIVTDLRIGPRN